MATTVKSLEAVVVELTARVAALEASLDKARIAFGELRVQVRARQEPLVATPVRAVGKKDYWRTALEELREECGHARAFIAPEEIKARARRLQELDQQFTDAGDDTSFEEQ
jgi:hypothetical protein